MKKQRERICVFMSFSGDGGVEKMVVNLVQGMLDAGYHVDLLLARAGGRHLESIPEGVCQIRLGTRHTLSALWPLAAYLRRERPAALLAAKDRAIKVAVIARWISGYRVRIAGRIGTTISAALEGKSIFRKWIWYTGMKFFYKQADHIVAVSRGVADDIQSITGIPDSRITVIPNPVITGKMLAQSLEPFDHSWFKDTEIPIIMGMGRLTRQKDFNTLIKAFAIVRATTPCRLLILGEGELRNELEALVSDLGLDQNVYLPGFVQNPYPYLSQSTLFVLSSRWEGSPNVLTEALSLGVPVVSTDCRSGPREVLQDGRYGLLVPVGDHESMAEAMLQTLNEHHSSEMLKEAVRRYTVSESVGGYLKALKLSDS